MCVVCIRKLWGQPVDFSRIKWTIALGRKRHIYIVLAAFSIFHCIDEYEGSWNAAIWPEGERVPKDFNIRKETSGSKRAALALIRTFQTNSTNTVMDRCQQSMLVSRFYIFFLWIYTIFIFPRSICMLIDGDSSSKRETKHVGRTIGIGLGCVAGFVIFWSLFYYCTGAITQRLTKEGTIPLRWPRFGAAKDQFLP